MNTPRPPRVIDPDLFEHLDPVEKLIGQKFLNEGKWILQVPVKEEASE